MIALVCFAGADQSLSGILILTSLASAVVGVIVGIIIGGMP